MLHLTGLWSVLNVKVVTGKIFAISATPACLEISSRHPNDNGGTWAVARLNLCWLRLTNATSPQEVGPAARALLLAGVGEQQELQPGSQHTELLLGPF